MLILWSSALLLMSLTFGHLSSQLSVPHIAQALLTACTVSLIMTSVPTQQEFLGASHNLAAVRKGDAEGCELEAVRVMKVDPDMRNVLQGYQIKQRAPPWPLCIALADSQLQRLQH